MSNSEILLYQTEDGQTKIDVRLEEETVWLSQTQMSELFQKERSVITKHIKNVFGVLRKVSCKNKAMCKFCTLVVPTVLLSFIILM